MLQFKLKTDVGCEHKIHNHNPYKAIPLLWLTKCDPTGLNCDGFFKDRFISVFFIIIFIHSAPWVMLRVTLACLLVLVASLEARKGWFINLSWQ